MKRQWHGHLLVLLGLFSGAGCLPTVEGPGAQRTAFQGALSEAHWVVEAAYDAYAVCPGTPQQCTPVNNFQGCQCPNPGGEFLLSEQRSLLGDIVPGSLRILAPRKNLSIALTRFWASGHGTLLLATRVELPSPASMDLICGIQPTDAFAYVTRGLAVTDDGQDVVDLACIAGVASGDTVPPDLDERLESARRDRNVCTATLAMARDEIAAANAEQPTRLSGEVTPWPPQGPATVDRGPFQCTAP